MTGLVCDMQMLYNLWGQGRRSRDLVSRHDITITYTQFVTYRPLIKFVKQHTALCRSVLQRVAVCCSVLQCVAVCCSVLSVLQWHTRQDITITHTQFVTNRPLIWFVKLISCRYNPTHKYIDISMWIFMNSYEYICIYHRALIKFVVLRWTTWSCVVLKIRHYEN